MSRAVVIYFWLALIGRVAAAAPGFDHATHDKTIKVECAKCHIPRANTLIAAPGHAACFGACHGPAPTKATAASRAADKLCTTCHAEAALREGKLAITRAENPDFALAIGHKTHGAVACAQCHTTTKRAPHQRCASCHDGKSGARGGPMTACASCHTASATPLRAGFVPAEIVVTSAFSHARHAARGGAGKQCATCHAALMATDSPQLPRTTAGSCAISGCHDGKASFSPIVACTKCHKDVPTAAGFKIARPPDPYSHTKHQSRGVGDCQSCHTLATSGEILINGHTVCSGCHDHAADFGRREPQICGACHNSTEPWRALTADRSPLPTSEFGATLDHQKHQAECASCHSLATAALQLRPERGHRSCTGSGCHAKSTGPVPRLATCSGCHQLGLADRRTTQQLTNAWSVRAQFDHTKHRRSTTGGVLACTACHVDLTAPTVLALAAPPKTTCAPCHDGDISFKLTGTTCTRCHLGKKP